MAYKQKYTGVFPTLPSHGKSNYLKKGDKGIAVKELQLLLNWANQGTIVAKLKIDGEYGEKTKKAVKFFQNVHHLVEDGEYGKMCQKTAKAMYMTHPLQAINWAISVSRDNSFAYGEERKGEPHRVKGKDGKYHTYEKTYCCNPFIFAAYAHGAEDAKIHAACRKGKCGGMSTRDWTKYKCFKVVGRCKDLKFSDMKAGDVIICDKTHHHVWMFTGKNGIVEASGGNWGKDSIKHKGGAKDRFKTYQKDKTAYVLRYTK